MRVVQKLSMGSLLLGLFACPPAPPPIDPPVTDPQPPDTSFFPGPTLSAELVFLDVDVSNRYDVAHYCDQMVTRHELVRALDLEDGSIRWRCGDIPGFSGESAGQEYCEYSAVSNGAVIDTAAAIDQASPFFCTFTSVFNDTPGRDQALLDALALPENLGATVTDIGVVRMQKEGFNARSAADGLIDACGNGFSEEQDQRQATCFHAARKAFDAGDLAAFEQIETACRNQDLTDNERWSFAKFVGVEELVEGQEGFEQIQEIAACMVASPSFSGFGQLDPLQSDDTICGRTFRAGQECGCDWSPIPNALDGFLFSDWITPTNPGNPPECRLANVDGQEYAHLMLCEVPAAEVAALPNDPAFANDLKGFCNERFGRKIGILAPLRAVEIPGTCSPNTQFCADFID
jgi:hypothetical protein